MFTAPEDLLSSSDLGANSDSSIYYINTELEGSGIELLDSVSNLNKTLEDLPHISTPPTTECGSPKTIDVTKFDDALFAAFVIPKLEELARTTARTSKDPLSSSSLVTKFDSFGSSVNTEPVYSSKNPEIAPSDSASDLDTTFESISFISTPTVEYESSKAIARTKSEDLSFTVVAMRNSEDSILTTTVTPKPPPPSPNLEPGTSVSTTDAEFEYTMSATRTSLLDSNSNPNARLEDLLLTSVLPTMDLDYLTRVVSSALKGNTSPSIPNRSVQNATTQRPPSLANFINKCSSLLSQAASRSQVYASIIGELFPSPAWTALPKHVRRAQVSQEQVIFVVFAVLGFFGSLGWFRLITITGPQ
jgi:hypothetical protein